MWWLYLLFEWVRLDDPYFKSNGSVSRWAILLVKPEASMEVPYTQPNSWCQLAKTQPNIQYWLVVGPPL